MSGHGTLEPVAQQDHAVHQGEDVAEAADGVPAPSEAVVGASPVGEGVLRGVERKRDGRGDHGVHQVPGGHGAG